MKLSRRRIDQRMPWNPQKANERKPRSARCSAAIRPMTRSSAAIRGRPIGSARWVRSIAATRAFRTASANAGLFPREMIPSPRQVSSQRGGTVSSARCSTKTDHGRCERRYEAMPWRIRRPVMLEVSTSSAT
jgi:hypothetical protein